MNTDDYFANEQMAFNEHFVDDHFDDSICKQHQSELRSQALQAFDHSNCESTPVVLQESSTGERQRESWKIAIGYLAVLAVCLIGLITFWFHSWDGLSERSMVEQPSVPDAAVDPQLVASLAEVNAYRNEVSREALFDAIAMCQRSQEGRMLFDSSQP